MASIDDAFADALLEGQLDLLRFEAGVRARILALLTRLQAELTAKLQTGNLTEFTKARLQTLLRQANATVERYYTAAAGEMNGAMAAAAKTSTTTVRRAVDAVVHLSAALPTEAFLKALAGNTILLGAPSSEWWSKQSRDTAWKFGNAVRQGVTQGETNEQIVARVAGSPRLGKPGIMEVARSNARSLVHTSIQAVANEARLETFRKNSDVIASLRWLATLDSHTCPICAPRDNKLYTLDDDPPEPIGHVLDWEGGPGAIHWGCRCVAVPVVQAFAGRVPQGGRATAGGPIPARVSFEQFLARKGVAYQEETLGKGRAELFRAKKLTLEQLLGDMTTTRLTLKELQRRYA